MAKREILAGATDQTIDVWIADSSSSTGAGLTGLVYNSASLTCYYRKGATGTATALTLATQTVGGAHSDGGFVEIDATNMPGWYRLDLSDTIVATAGMVSLHLQGATNMAPTPAEIEVIEFNKYDRRFQDAVDTIVQGVVDTGASTISLPTSSLDPAASSTDQFRGLIIKFDKGTTTAGLRGSASTVTASTAGGTLTVSPALPATPASGDTFTLE